jgi:hypothetical protein
MDPSIIYSIGLPIVIMGIILFIILRYKKFEPLTYPEFFIKDRNPKYLHVLGAKRIMPDEGDSFDIFEHYVFDLDELKFIKGEGQKGKDLNLQSEFVKRNMQLLGEKLNTRLELVQHNEDYDDKEDGLLKIYHFDYDQSDTEVYDDLKNDNLTFIKRHSTNRDIFTMILCRHGKEMHRYEMKGMCDYFFKCLYFENRSWICFLYNKERGIYSNGIALCILNYETGDMIYDGFVKPGKR